MEEIKSLLQELHAFKGIESMTERERLRQSQLYNQLEQRYMPLLRTVVCHYRGLDNYDDLWQIIRYSFYQSSLQYDIDGNVFFGYYCKRKLYGDLRTHTRRTMGMRKREQPIEHENSVAIEDSAFEKWEWRRLLVESRLTEKEYILLLLIYEGGYRQIDIANKWNIDRSTVRKYHQRALEKLRKEILKP